LLLALLLSAAASRVSACIGQPSFNPQAKSHFMDASDKSGRFFSGSADLNQDDILYILLPLDAKVDTGNGNETLNRIIDMRVLESPQFRELSPTLAMEASLPLQNGKKGHAWWAFQAIGGTTTLTIDIGGKQTALNVRVKPYIPAVPEPVKISLEKAARENPFGMRAGQAFEITLPGELAAGWTVDSLKESGVTLKALTQIQRPAGAGGQSQPEVRLVFEVSRSSYSRDPQHISIRRAGLFSGATFDLYLVFYPVPTC
jgi:hypothetical protein